MMRYAAVFLIGLFVGVTLGIWNGYRVTSAAYEREIEEQLVPLIEPTGCTADDPLVSAVMDMTIDEATRQWGEALTICQQGWQQALDELVADDEYRKALSVQLDTYGWWSDEGLSDAAAHAFVFCMVGRADPIEDCLVMVMTAYE